MYSNGHPWITHGHSWAEIGPFNYFLRLFSLFCRPPSNFFDENVQKIFKLFEFDVKFFPTRMLTSTGIVFHLKKTFFFTHFDRNMLKKSVFIDSNQEAVDFCIKKW